MRQRDFVLCGERTHRLKSLLFPKSGFCSIFAVFVVDFRESSFFSTVSESPPALQLRTSCALFFTETSVKKKKTRACTRPSSTGATGQLGYSSARA